MGYANRDKARARILAALADQLLAERAAQQARMPQPGPSARNDIAGMMLQQSPAMPPGSSPPDPDGVSEAVKTLLARLAVRDKAGEVEED